MIHLSTEGLLLVRTDRGPTNQLRLAGDVLEVISPDQTDQRADIWVRPDGAIVPGRVGDLTLLGYHDHTLKTVQFANTGSVDNLAVKLSLQSDRMGQTLERWLALAPAGYRQVDLGPARLELVLAPDEAELDTLLHPPTPTVTGEGQLQLGDRTVPVAQLLHQPLSLSQGITATVTHVWPDFRLDANVQPQSVSSQFRNPAVQLELTQGSRQERRFVFAQPGVEPVRSGDAIALEVTYDAPTAPPEHRFRVVAAPDGRLFYAAVSDQGVRSGPFTVGDTVTPGWADLQITLLAQLDRAVIQRQVVPMTPVAAVPSSGQGQPALQVITPDGQDFWLSWGEPLPLPTAQGEYLAAFGPRLMALPFYVKLDDFIVERNEGSDSVAMWTSQITLFDPQTDTAVQRSVWINHPTWFRGWKLAQASWNPGDLQQSTLQVKREPWWVTALTWSGSVLVVLGIAVMFYGPGLRRRLRPVAAASDPTAPAATPGPPIPLLAVFDKPHKPSTTSSTSSFSTEGKVS